MNNARRKAIDKILVEIEERLELLENLKNEEEECFDNLPLSIQDSDRGSYMANCVVALDDFKSEVADLIENLRETTEAQ
jgi:hypothetical protein